MRTAHALAMLLMVAAAATLVGCAAASPSPAPSPVASPDQAPAPALTEAVPVPAEPARVVVSYFHRTIRCETCIKFEALADRALRDAFADELATGRLEWRVADFEEPGHESDVARYDIVESSLIVSRYAGDAEIEWKKLDGIWSLATDDSAFVGYVRGEIGAYLGGETDGD